MAYSIDLIILSFNQTKFKCIVEANNHSSYLSRSLLFTILAVCRDSSPVKTAAAGSKYWRPTSDAEKTLRFAGLQKENNPILIAFAAKKEIKLCW
jgi:hypothetical protein